MNTLNRNEDKQEMKKKNSIPLCLPAQEAM